MGLVTPEQAEDLPQVAEQRVLGGLLELEPQEQEALTVEELAEPVAGINLKKKRKKPIAKQLKLRQKLKQ